MSTPLHLGLLLLISLWLACGHSTVLPAPTTTTGPTIQPEVVLRLTH